MAVKPTDEEGWYQGRLDGEFKAGLFPANYVRFEEDPPGPPLRAHLTGQEDKHVVPTGSETSIPATTLFGDSPPKNLSLSRKVDADATRRQLLDKSSELVAQAKERLLTTTNESTGWETGSIAARKSLFEGVQTPPVPSRPITIVNSSSSRVEAVTDALESKLDLSVAHKLPQQAFKRPAPPTRKPPSANANPPQIPLKPAALQSPVEAPSLPQRPNHKSIVGVPTAIAVKPMELSVVPNSSNGVAARIAQLQSGVSDKPSFRTQQAAIKAPGTSNINPYIDNNPWADSIAPPIPRRPISTPIQAQTLLPIPEDQYYRYKRLFEEKDLLKRGLLTNNDVKPVWNMSRLSRKQLAGIWDLVHVGKTGGLTLEQFVIGMFLIDDQLKGNPMPMQLPPHVLRFIGSY